MITELAKKLNGKNYSFAFKSNPLVDILIAGLLRGIGIHHKGLPRRYLITVELLYRLHFLTMLISTTTLALGIHMPCRYYNINYHFRTVIFIGDHVSLTPLIYRQVKKIL